MASKDAKGRFFSNHPDYKHSKGRSKKRPRQFLGQKDKDAPDEKKSRPSTSSKKLLTASSTTEFCDTRNRIIDINILFPQLANVVCCNECHSKLQFSESGTQGLGFRIDVVCVQCAQVASIPSSKKVGTMNSAWEVNRRSALAARALGQGLAGLSTFCGILDLPKPVAHSAYDNINEQLSQVCEEVAQESMNVAVQEEKDSTPASDPGLAVSGDGSWRKKGFSSLQGIASVLGDNTGKVLDVAVKNSFCGACSLWKDKQETSAYQEWYEEHKPYCTANHEGCAGKMEVDGICEIFQRSEEKYGVSYQYYISDGDTKVFKTLCDLKPYGDRLQVEKKECVGHVQKRMGTRLRNLKKSLGRQVLSDGKGIGGRGRLTAQVIDKLTSYYGKAIRDNSDSAENMHKAIWASFYHQQSTDEKPQHHLCPEGTSSWCAWQKAKALNRLTSFRHKSSIPSAVMEKIKSVYEDLTKEDLLKRCIGGFTQNANESFNNSVWKLNPKTSFSGMTTLKIGVYTAVTCFNDGRSGFLKIMKKFGIEPGRAAVEWVNISDDTRLFHAKRKTLASTKEARINRRRARDQVPEDAYSAGAN